MKILTSGVRKSLKREDGQSIFLVAIMVMSFIMFFSFTINTGLLIHAKISVQAAADAAAYSGAATQGRLLNAISYLNYDMRRQYKKFLFRNAFVGSMSNPNFPQGAPGASGARYDFPKFDYSGAPLGTSHANSKQMKSLTVPVICIPMMTAGNSNTQGDNCIAVNARNTAADLQIRFNSNRPSFMQGMMGPLYAAQNAFSSMQDALCQSQGLINQYTVMAWAFRGNNDDSELFSFIDAMFTANSATGAFLNIAQKPKIIDQVRGLVGGVGLYPKNLFTFMRIKTLVEFLNDPPHVITRDDVPNLEKDGETKERSILAFKSAASNLNTEVFDASRTELHELQPANVIQNVDLVPADLDIFVQAMDITKQVNLNSNTICQAAINQIPLKNAPIGVNITWTPQKNVIYGVKLKAYIKPRGLFFAPWNEPLELDAYAGAKPFGSRVGPVVMKPEDEFFEYQKTISVLVNGDYFCNSSLGQGHTCNIPNMGVGGGATFFDRDYLSELRNVALDPVTNTFNSRGINKAVYMAMAPTSNEVGRYNILPPPPLKNDGTLDTNAMNYEFLPYADPNSILTAKNSPDNDAPAYRFYAPIYKKGTGDPKTLIQQYLNNALQGNLPPKFGITMADIKNRTRDGMFDYLAKLEAGVGTLHNETATFAAVELPMYTPMLRAGTSKQYWLMSASQVLSSFGAIARVPGNKFGIPSRFGYSVRFVSLPDLLKEGLSDPDGEIDQITH